MPNLRLWTREFIVAIFVNLFMSTVFYMLLTSMALYAVTEFRASETMAGLAASGFIIGAIFGRLFSGKFLDFVGRRRLLVLCMVLYFIAALAYIPVANLFLLIALRIIHGFAFGAGNTALVAGVQGIIPPQRRAEGNGYFGTASTVATALGPFAAVYFSEHYSFTVVFLVSAACSLIGLLASWFFIIPERELSESELAEKWRFDLASFIDVGALRIGLIMLISGLAYATVLSFLPMHTERLGIAESSSVFFATYAIVALLARVFAGRIQDKYGDNVVAVPVFITFGVGLFIIGVATTGFHITVAGVALGIGFGTLLPALQAILINQVPAARVGVATSTFYLLLDIGSGLGPVALGLVVEFVGFPAMFQGASLLAVAAGILYFFFHGRAAKRPLASV